MAGSVGNQHKLSPLNEDEIHDGIPLEEAAYYNASRGTPKPGVPIAPRPAFKDRTLLIESIKRGENPIWVPDQEGASTSPPQGELHVVEPGLALRQHEKRWSTSPQPITYNKGRLRRAKQLHMDSSTPDTPPPSTPPRPPTSVSEQQQQSSGPALSFSPPARRASLGRVIGVGSFHEPSSPLANETRFDDDDDEPETPTSSRARQLALARRNTLSGPVTQPHRTSSFQVSPLARLDEIPSDEPESSHSRLNPFQMSSSLPFSTSPRLLGARGRRASLSSGSSLQLSSLVGSYEESILRGRMSGMPSDPITFTAMLSAHASGNYRPMHPATVSLDFPAVFHRWTPGQGRETTPRDQVPTPYVGQIDLKGSPLLKIFRIPRRRRSRTPTTTQSEVAGMLTSRGASSSTSSRPQTVGPVGGIYRIPDAGAIQILVKNQEAAGLAMLRIPYDVSDMEVGHKTWIRQRIYEDVEIQTVEPPVEPMPETVADPPKESTTEIPASDPIHRDEPTVESSTEATTESTTTSTSVPLIENPVGSSSKQETGPLAESEIETMADPPRTREVLRYMVVVRICRPLSELFLLYNDIRVVFPSNTVVVRIEDMRAVADGPIPRYTPLYPDLEIPILPRRRLSMDSGPQSPVESSQDLTPGSPSSSAPFSFSPTHQPLELMQRRPTRSLQSLAPQEDLSEALGTMTLQAQPPSNEQTFAAAEAPSENAVTEEEIPSDLDGTYEREPYPYMHASIQSISSNGSTYSKLSRGEAGYGGRPGTPDVVVGLLSQGLRSLSASHDENDIYD